MWDDLKTQAAAVADRSILSLFDGARADGFAVETQHMRFDYAKTNIDGRTRELLLALAQQAGVAARRDAMFAGDKINETEGRAVLHTALRNLDGGPVYMDGVDVMPGVLDTLARMERYATEVRASAITDVVNIGIGGSDLGPAMAVQALSPYHDGPRVHFVSNVDGAHIADCLRGLDAKTTLVIVASKTFTTIETMTNARTARAWMVDHGGDPASQYAALSTAVDKTEAFGIPSDRVFGFEDWVGGRYSMWGPIGLSLMIAIGPEGFRAFLRGGQEMDRHFRAADALDNMPLMLALVGIWHRQVCGYASRAVLPYDQRLGQLPAYLQQLEMESNGKSAGPDGASVTGATAPALWGGEGSVGQHSYHQWLHQGSDIVPTEFILAPDANGEPDGRIALSAHALAQAEVLANGRSLDDVKAEEPDLPDAIAKQKVHKGGRPSTFLYTDNFDPAAFGALIALYEHRTFIAGRLWGINSFDQWGVELGKRRAKSLTPLVRGDAPSEDAHPSVRNLVKRLHALRNPQ